MKENVKKNFLPFYSYFRDALREMVATSWSTSSSWKERGGMSDDLHKSLSIIEDRVVRKNGMGQGGGLASEVLPQRTLIPTIKANFVKR